MALTDNPNGKTRRRRDEDHAPTPSLARSSKSTTAPSEHVSTRRYATRSAFRHASTKLTDCVEPEKAETRAKDDCITKKAAHNTATASEMLPHNHEPVLSANFHTASNNADLANILNTPVGADYGTTHNYKKRPRTDCPVVPGDPNAVSNHRNVNKNHSVVVGGNYSTVSNKQSLNQNDGLLVGANDTASNPNKNNESSIVNNYAANSRKRQRTSKAYHNGLRNYTTAPHNNKNITKSEEPNVVAPCDGLRNFVTPANTGEPATAVHHATHMEVDINTSNSNRLGVANFSSEIIDSVGNGQADLHNLVRVPDNLPQPTTRKHILELTELPLGVQDIDVKYVGAGAKFTEWPYALMIHQNLWWQEAEPKCNNLYSVGQRITRNNRRILVDWIVEVHAQYGLQNHTLHLAVSILDRFLAQQEVSSIHRRLVSATAVCIASQYEEGQQDLLAAFASDGCYAPFEFMHMEVLISISLKWDIPVPTMLPFVARALKALRIPDVNMIQHFAEYACELALCDASVLTFVPSQIAAAAVALGAHLFTAVKVVWDTTQVFHTGGYGYTELGPSMCYLWNLVRRDGRERTTFHAVLRKYSSAAYRHVAVKVRSLKYNGIVGRYGESDRTF